MSFSTKGMDRQQEKELVKQMKKSNRPIEVALVICQIDFRTISHSIVGKNLGEMNPQKNAMVTVITGDTPKSALDVGFEPKDVSWILFFPEEKYLKKSIEEVEDIWGKSAKKQVIKAMEITQKNFTNKNIETFSVGITDVRCRCPGEKCCCECLRKEKK